MLELRDLENKSLYIIREAYAEFKRPAVLWSTGKDSTATLWLCKKAFFGKIGCPVAGSASYLEHLSRHYRFQQTVKGLFLQLVGQPAFFRQIIVVVGLRDLFFSKNIHQAEGLNTFG